MLASRLCREFDLKWVGGGATADEQLIGSSDIQSLADLGNSFQVIAKFSLPVAAKIRHPAYRYYPVTSQSLVFTMIPLEELIIQNSLGGFLMPGINAEWTRATKGRDGQGV